MSAKVECHLVLFEVCIKRDDSICNYKEMR